MDLDERALLAAIIAHPDEDTPRLMYADWLQEHDQPERAEYIRLSIQLANLRYGEPDLEERKRELDAKRGPLRRRFMDIWKAEVAAQLPPMSSGSFFSFSRGFVERVCCPVTYFLTHADALLRVCPLRTFRPNVPTATMMQRLVRSRHFRRLSTLQFTFAHYAPALLACPSVGIETVVFDPDVPPFSQFSGRWDQVAAAVAAHTGLKSVKVIGFERSAMTDEAGRALAAAPYLDPERLNLLDNEFSEPVKQSLRARYGSRVWIEEADRAGTLCGDDD